MALKPDRHEFLTDLSYFMNETAEEGVLVVHDGTGSGVAMDDSSATVKKPSVLNADVESGNPAGLLLTKVVDIDLTRQHINYHQNEVQKGGKVLLLREGTVTTDQVSGTPTAGEKAHFTLTGQLVAASDDDTSAQVGRFLSSKNADGFAKVEIKIV